jgi:hypothetical protein
LDSVREAVTEAWVLEAAMEKAKAEGEKFMDALVKQLVGLGESQNPLPQPLLQSFSEPLLISRGQSAALDQQSLQTAFKLGMQGKARVGGLVVPDQGFRVMVLGAVVPVPEEQLKSAIPMVREQLASLEGRLLSEQYLRYLRGRAAVKTYPNRIANSNAKP